MDIEQPHQELVKCVVVGDTAVGKTRLICARACNSRLDLNQLMQTHIPTVWAIDQYRMHKEVLERSCETVDGVSVSLRLWDTFGDHEKDRRFAYGRSDVVLLCFSIGNPTSLRNCRLVWYPEIRRFCPNTPIVLVGCKNDLRYMYRDEQFLSLCRERSPFYRANHNCSRFTEFGRPLRESDILTPDQGRSVARDMNAPYFESSVFTHYGVNEVFENVIRVALASRRQQRFWVTNLRNIKRPMLQHPFCPPRPRSPVVTVAPSDYQSHLQHLFDSESFADAVILVNDTKFYVHRIILTAGSSVFQRLFSLDLISEEKQKRKKIQMMTKDSLQPRAIMTDTLITVTRSEDDDSGTSMMSTSIGSSMSSQLTRSVSDSSICSSLHDSITSSSKESDTVLKTNVNAFFKGHGVCNPDLQAKQGSQETHAVHPSTLHRLSSLKTTAAAIITSAAVSCIPRPSSIASSTSSAFSSTLSASNASTSSSSALKVKIPFPSNLRRKSLSWQDLQVCEDGSSNRKDWKTLLPVKKELTTGESTLFASVGLEFFNDSTHESRGSAKKDGRVIVTLKVRKNLSLSGEAFRVCLYFMYTGEIISVSNSSVIEEVLDLSELLELTDLTNEMHKSLKDIDILFASRVEPPSHDGVSFTTGFQRRLLAHGLVDGLYSDVTFQLEDGCVSGHRPLLMARCEVMQAMFRGDFMESSAQTIRFPGLRKETFSQLLHFLYADSIGDDVNVSNCVSLLALANRLCLPRLLSLVENKIISDLRKMMSPSTPGSESCTSPWTLPSLGMESATELILSLLEPCQMHNADQLVEFCLHHISVNYREITHKQSKFLRSLHPENQAYLNKNRWPPVWFQRELDFYERCVREREWNEKLGKGVKRHCINSVCSCFSRKSKRQSDLVDKENYY